jgi:alpha-mannosidase
LLATTVGDAPLDSGGEPLVEIDPREIVLSALKPAERGGGFVLRVLNPTNESHEAVVRFGFDISSASATRLDEEPAPHPVVLEGRELRFEVPSHALRSVLVS